jgi:hypothetical protein
VESAALLIADLAGVAVSGPLPMAAAAALVLTIRVVALRRRWAAPVADPAGPPRRAS